MPEIPPERDGPADDAHASFVLAEVFADISDGRGEDALERLKALTIGDMDTLVFRLCVALTVVGEEAGYGTDKLTELLRAMAEREASKLVNEEFPDNS